MGLLSSLSGKTEEGGAQVKAKAKKTAQQTIPYKYIYTGDCDKEGIIEVTDGFFVRSFMIQNTNYSDVGDERQDEILRMFEKTLNSFDHNHRYEITINKKNVDMTEFTNKVLMPYQYDEELYDELRRENNDILRTNLQEGTNNIKPEIYFTIGVNGANLEDARQKLSTAERAVNVQLKKITDSEMKPMSLASKMECLYNIYNLGQEENFSKTRKVNGKEVKGFDTDLLQKMKISSKDIIAPSSFEFYNNYLMIGDKYARVLFLKSVPSHLSSALIETLSQVPTNMITSIHYTPIEQQKAVDFATAQYTNIGGDVVKAQQNLSKAGASIDLLPPKLATAQADATQLLDDLTNNNMTLMHVSVIITLFADTLDDLNDYTNALKSRAKTLVCQVEVLTTQQEAGFNASLPLCLNTLHVNKVMTSNTASAVQPFSSREFNQDGGFSYGINTQSRNILRYNRLSVANPNAVILGIPGGGKSVTAKLEIQQIFLNKGDAQIRIIDPEREYKLMCKKFNGTIIRIAPGSHDHINPLDLDISKDDDGESSPLNEKIDFVTSLCERMIGHGATLSGEYKNIIDQTLTQLYTPYISELEKEGKTIDTEKCPTLVDFFNALKQRPEAEARNLAQNIQIYCTGYLNIFAYKTNVDTQSKIVVYDTLDIGENLLDLGMTICMSDIWNSMIRNKKRNVRTWFYVDEMHLMLKNAGTAAYLQMIWKRARKWMGCPTGLTQNVGDLLNNQWGQAILLTSEMAVMLKQSPFDRTQLSSPQLYNISEEQQEYITNAGPGQGLLRIGSTIVPFTNVIPTSTQLYKLISTKSEDAEESSKK